MTENNETKSFYAIVLFIVWPFLAFISALRNYKKSWAMNVCWAFAAFFGLTFAIGSGNEGSDITRYIAGYQAMHNVDLTFTDAINLILQSKSIDIFQISISVVLSRFTDIPAVLTITYGIIFGFFFSRNMWFVLERVEGKLQFITIMLLVCYFLVIPIWDMNGFRMWTAAHIFLYGLLPYLFEGKKKGLMISIFAMLVHYTFIVPILVLFCYLVFGNRTTLFFFFFIITLFFSEINIETFNNLIENYAPEILQERTSSYRAENKVENFREGRGQTGIVWYALLYDKALRWAVSGFLIVLFFRGKEYLQRNIKSLNLFSFVLLFYGSANILSSLPSGYRFLSVANLIALSLIIIYVQNYRHDKIMRRFIWVATPLLLIFTIVSLRIGLYSMSVSTILGNPIIALFMGNEHLSLNEILKTIL